MAVGTVTVQTTTLSAVLYQHHLQPHKTTIMCTTLKLPPPPATIYTTLLMLMKNNIIYPATNHYCASSSSTDQLEAVASVERVLNVFEALMCVFTIRTKFNALNLSINGDSDDDRYDIVGCGAAGQPHPATGPQ